jgi:N-acetylneuraminate synthase
MVVAAAESGADAVKLQTYTPDTITLNARTAPFMIGEGSLWAGRTLYDLYQEAFTPWEWFPRLAEVARDNSVDMFSSPFDQSAVDFLEEQGVPAFKIASFELIDDSLVAAVARTGKPVILSTGMASLAEIDEAVGVARAAGAEQLALLRCNSGYPTPSSEMDLRTIPNMIDAFGIPVGLSDHTPGTEASIVARAFGACILEKHFVLDRSSGTLDAEFSLEPDEFAAMVVAVRNAEEMLGSVRYGPTARELHSIEHRRSLFVTEDLAAGDVLTSMNVRSIRPGHGLAPEYLQDVLGATVSEDVARGTPLAWDMVLSRSETYNSKV